MRPIFTAVLCFLSFGSNAFSQDSISPETLAAIKRATVYVKVDAKLLSGTGSGFVIQVDGDSALVVTNHHVIEPEIQIEFTPKIGRKMVRPPFGRPPGLTPRLPVMTLKDVDVTLVFDSGTKSERSAKAQVVAIDPERDLAVLRVKGVKDLPAALDLSAAPKLAETMPVYTFGFPFGKVLATGKGHPAITIGKAAISSLRQNDDGELAMVQIDGALNPGNSGGPIVDAKGLLVGVAVATIRNSSGIGLAIPGGELRRTLLGRLGAIHVTTKDTGKDKTTVHVEAGVIDPLDKIAAITLHVLPTSAKDGETPKELSDVAGCHTIKLTLEKQLASADLSLDAKDAGKELLLQAEVVDVSGKKSLAKVIRHRKSEAVAKIGEPGPKGPVVTYIYVQSTGKLTLNDELLGVGHSGRGATKNDHAKQAEKDGPIPLGSYLLAGFRDDPIVGGKVMALLPVAGGDYFGRFPAEAFAIIAESDRPPSGCFIILPRAVLEKLSTNPFSKVQVVK